MTGMKEQRWAEKTACPADKKILETVRSMDYDRNMYGVASGRLRRYRCVQQDGFWGEAVNQPPRRRRRRLKRSRRDERSAARSSSPGWWRIGRRSGGIRKYK